MAENYLNKTGLQYFYNRLKAIFAPISHASAQDTYGLGSSTNYGHVKLSDATNGTSTAAGGVAATPKAVSDALASATGAIPAAATAAPIMDGTAAVGTSAKYAKEDHVHPTDTSRAPTSHATNATTYGAGTGTVYGHVKLSDATDGTAAATSGGTAATPKAVKDALAAAKTYADGIADDIPLPSDADPEMDGTATAGGGFNYSRSDHVHPTDTSRAPKSHASSATTYGAGTDSNYGHVKLSDAINGTAAAASGGTAATPKAVADAITAATGAIPSPADATPLMDGTAAVGTSTDYAREDHRHPSDTTKADKTATVSTVTFDTTNAKFTKTINGTTTDIVDAATLKAALDYTNADFGQGFCVCETAAATAAKTASITGYEIYEGGIVSVYFENDVPASATLNISNTGAYHIWHGGDYIAAGIIKAGDTATLMYSNDTAIVGGYVLLTIDRDDIYNNTWYGECSTAASTQTKVVTTSTGDFPDTAGSMLRVRFDNNQTYDGVPILSVDSSVSGNIRERMNSGGTVNVYGYKNMWKSGEVVDFLYTGNGIFIAVGKVRATAGYYGIVKLSDSTTSTSGADDGIAASPAAVKAAYDLADGKASLASPTFTGTPAAPTAAAGTNTTQIATTAFVQAAVQAAQVGAATFKGTVNAGTDISNLTAYSSGWYWVVATAGTYVGQTCEVGDMIFCISDYSSAYSADDFSVVQNNLDLVAITTAEIDAILAA